MSDEYISRKEAKQTIKNSIASASTVARIWDKLDELDNIILYSPKIMCPYCGNSIIVPAMNAREEKDGNS